jgi:hypothetical protein
VSVVAGDVVGAEQGCERREENLENAAPRRFAGDDEAGVGAEFNAEDGEFGRGKVMEDEVADDDGVGGVIREGDEVGLVPDAGGEPGDGAGAAVETVEVDFVRLEGDAEFAGAGAKFEHRLVGVQKRGEGAGEPAEVAHGPVDEAEIAAAVKGGGVIRRERVEELGLQHAGHRERKVARSAQGVQCARQFIA